MRKILLVIVSLVLLFSLVGGAKAQAVGFPNPGITPDSFFYFLDIWGEKIGMFFAFGAEAKAKKALSYAEERLAEAEAMVEKNKPREVGIATVGYEGYIAFAQGKVEEARARGRDISEVSERVAEATAKHLTVLEEVLERVPEQAKPAILRAREVSKTGQVRALENLSKERPERGAILNLQAIQGRLRKARKEAAELDEEGVGRALADFVVFRASLEKIGKENKTVLASLVSEKITGQIGDLDELEDEVEDISPKMAEKVKAIKESAINGQIDVLRSLASVDPERATEINLKAAEARLNRANQRAEEGEIEEMEEALGEFENQHKFGEEISEIAQGLGKDITTLDQLIGKATSIHLEVLAEVYEKVPEEAKEAIEKAMEVSVKGHEKAVEALKEKEALDEVPEEVPMPERLPEEIRERVREQVRREIEAEEVEVEEEEVEIEVPEVEIPETPRP